MFKSFLKYSLIVITTCLVICGCEDISDAISNASEEAEQVIGHHENSNISIVSFGSPNVSKAQEDPMVQIKGLKINGRSGLSYSFSSGNLSMWGLAYDNAGAIAVAGYLEGDHYVCGKFDWISSSRKTRDFENINSGYNGWQPEKFYGARKRCFFIMKADGKKRTNIITD